MGERAQMHVQCRPLPDVTKHTRYQSLAQARACVAYRTHAWMRRLPRHR